MRRRSSGILLHITSLPSPYGIGDLGKSAYRFVDFLVEARQSFWQILPLNPTSTIHGNSPYSSDSAFAGDPLLISPELLEQEGLLSKSELEGLPSFPNQRVDYKAVHSFKKRLLLRAYERYRPRLEKEPEFERFVRKNIDWLEDYALFKVVKSHYNGVSWNNWPKDIRDRDERAVNEYKEKFKDQILLEQFCQFIFFKQWRSLKRYCISKEIQIIGDLPIYVQHDSSDVWAHSELFKLDEEKRPSVVAGVPPDYFSATGQRWGNPIYDWERHRSTGYRWWIRRFTHDLKLYHLVRLDHFRGFVAYWEAPANEPVAVNGRWVEAPAEDFLKTLLKHFPCLPIIAEDLGIITAEVREIMRQFRIPGMKVLLFAFGDNLPVHPYAPHNYTRDCVVYTGTHDSNTIKGWLESEATPEDRTRLFAYLGRQVSEELLDLELAYLGRKVSEEQIHWDLIRLAMMSVAKTVIMPIQDILGLGEEARTNRPATSGGNWEWRLSGEELTPQVIAKLSEMTEVYGRI